MRDKRFVAEHRGGSLKKEQHQQLMQWGCNCAEHVLSLYGKEIDKRLKNALSIAK
ncbi:MAG: putative immunity protein, partial [Candidatus Thorarchaeota archaeon]